MTKGRRSVLVLIIYILVGALIGGILGELLSNITPYLNWLALGKNPLFSLNPSINASMIKFGFNLSMSINIGSLLGIILGIIIWRRH